MYEPRLSYKRIFHLIMLLLRQRGFVWDVFVVSAILNYFATLVSSQGKQCQSHTTCAECLTTTGCSWCSDSNFSRIVSRCDLENELLDGGCNSQFISSPKSEVFILKNLPLSFISETTDDIIQMGPQEFRIKLRPNDPIKINITFQQAKNYPVDLYYLMDLTFSMKEHKERVAELADNLAEIMFNITSNFRMGFGSFIDKIVMPFADMVPSRLQNPCRDYHCSPAYGFQNHLPLDKNTSLFVSQVLNANVSGNLDDAEGGFDAIMQAIVCKEHIRWSSLSRKILVFATDSMFHYAGDGKLGGIVKPNDGQCHLDSLGLYTESIYQDYPSLGQLNSKISASGVNLIFVVPENRLPLYETLSNMIQGSHAAKLSQGSSNIVELIQDQYQIISSKVILKDDAPEELQIKYLSSCLGKTQKFENTCEGLEVGNSVIFEAKLNLLSCPKDRSKWKQTITITPVGLTESVKLNIEYICNCGCEITTNKSVRSEECNLKGVYECGICSCDPNYFGSDCQCTGDDNTKEDTQQLCVKKGSNETCSGRGDCVCGKCECYINSGIRSYGQFCECDASSCERDANGQICGGPSRGKCCGECECLPGWSGVVCDCTAETSGCENPETGKICSGHGYCDCGKCRCYSDEKGSRYGGPFCDDCATCEGHCSEFRPCVQCQVFQTSTLNREQCVNCSFKAVVLDELTDSPEEKHCFFKDEDDCTFEFQYSYDSEYQPVVRVKKTKECPQEVEILWIVVGVSGSVFVIGVIVLLVVRFCMYLKDKRDYEKFLAEVNQKTKWGDETNPIYKGAISNFQNPIYHASEN